MGCSEHQPIAYQGAATEPIGNIVVIAIAQARHMRKFLGIGRCAVDYQRRVAVARVQDLIGDRRIWEQKTVAILLIKDALLVPRTSFPRDR